MDDPFLRAGIEHYAEAHAAIEAFDRRIGERLASVLRGRTSSSVAHACSREGGPLWVFAYTEPAAKSASADPLSLQIGLVWRSDLDDSCLLYAGYTRSRGRPAEISGRVEPPMKLLPWWKGHFLCTAPNAEDLNTQFTALLDRLDNLLEKERDLFLKGK